MKKLFLKRLGKAIAEHGVTRDDIFESYVANTHISSKESAKHNFNRLKMSKSAVTINDIVACAKACNCTSDYLLGLSDRMN